MADHTPGLLEAARAATRIPILQGQRSSALARLQECNRSTVESIRVSRQEAQDAAREIDALWRNLRAAIAKAEGE